MTSTRFPLPLKISALVLLALTLACGATPTPAIDQLSTVVASTLQALTPAASATLPIPTAALPSATLPPPTATRSNLPAASRISFATGATESVVTGTLGAGQTVYYVVNAGQDQPMLAMLDSPEHDMQLTIFGANGVVLLPASQHTSNWQGNLPSTQDYYFGLTGGGSGQNFTLNLIVAARIQFGAGQTKVTLSGQTVGGYAVTYVARASAGQKMDVEVDTSSDVAALTIWGFTDGQPYARAQNGVTDFSMTLPSTQDYIIEVVPQGGQVVNFKVSVRIK